MRRFWVQTIVAGIARLTPSRPTDNALSVSSIVSKLVEVDGGPETQIFAKFINLTLKDPEIVCHDFLSYG
jgi:hypothetical protein